MGTRRQWSHDGSQDGSQDGSHNGSQDWLGHLPIKAVVELAHSRVSGMVITDIPPSPPGLDACATCVVGKSMHLPHKVGHQGIWSVCIST